MNNAAIQNTLDTISVIREASRAAYNELLQGDKGVFLELASNMMTLLKKTIIDGREQVKEDEALKIPAAAESTLWSLEKIVAYSGHNIPLALNKIEFELIPFVDDLYADYYFRTCVIPFREKWDDYFANDIKILFGNPYVLEAEKEGYYKYDLSIAVTAYNKLEYTRRCIESILDNLPEKERIELVLINHGSNDGTKEFFESIRPTKQLDIKINGSFRESARRIYEGEFVLNISNDVLIMPHAIENMLRALREDPEIGLVVPSTTNVSNYQTLPATFSDSDEMIWWAESNNAYDPYRHELRTRLVNPLQMSRNKYMNEVIHSGYVMSSGHNITSFPDDRQSLLFRRKGYKLVLLKDAFCHHFGSVTIKDELERKTKNEDEIKKLYLESCTNFEAFFGIDPWGSGACYDHSFTEFDCKFDGHIEILGINTGIGANPLKVKELYKENSHNLDARITYVDHDEKYFEEVKAFADECILVNDFPELFVSLKGKRYNYILVEQPFSSNAVSIELIERFADFLVPSGELYLNIGTEIKSKVYECIMPKEDEYHSKWVRLIKR